MSISFRNCTIVHRLANWLLCPYSMNSVSISNNVFASRIWLVFFHVLRIPRQYGRVWPSQFWNFGFLPSAFRQAWSDIDFDLNRAYVLSASSSGSIGAQIFVKGSVSWLHRRGPKKSKFSDVEIEVTTECNSLKLGTMINSLEIKLCPISFHSFLAFIIRFNSCAFNLSSLFPRSMQSILWMFADLYEIWKLGYRNRTLAYLRVKAKPTLLVDVRSMFSPDWEFLCCTMELLK